MRRWLYFSVICLAVVTGGVLLQASASRPETSDKARDAKQKAPIKDFVIKVEPWGPTQEVIDQAIESVTKDPAVERYLAETQYRLITVEYVDPDNKKGNNGPPDRFRVIYYDYTNERSIIVLSQFSKPGELDVSVSWFQPLPSPDEFDAAVKIIENDSQLGAALREKKLVPYFPMPPLYFAPGIKTRPERVLNVGLRAKNPDDPAIERENEIVAVGMGRQSVRRFTSGAPPTSSAQPAADCSPPPSGGSSTGRGVAGQYQFEINDLAGVQLWSFLAIRPSASSGSDGSAIELRDVRYRGRMVLKRANVPILNVLYDNNACGPFRDWQYAENQFAADPTAGTTLAPGVRLCTVPATTVLETDIDSGNHQGIAYYKEGNGVVLVSELSAGWYRYISEWRFLDDGTIKPRFGMGAVQNSCTCLPHVHHAYWRFDFDIDGAAPNRILEPRGRIFNAFPVPLEAKRYRKAGSQETWIVDNPATGNSYLVRSNISDNSASNDPYARGDLWFLTYSGAEFDDSAVRTNTQANIDAFLTNNKLNNNDIVIWYGGHIPHNRGMYNRYHDHSINGPTVAGPDLIPLRWQP